MILIIKIFYESILLAFQQITSNKLRAFLSLLGISIGIFCIIAVQTSVDSLQGSIKNGFGELGSDVVFIDALPWDEDPGQNFWKYNKRPSPSYDDYLGLSERLKNASEVSYAVFTQGKTIKHKSSSVQGAFVMGTTHDYIDVQSTDIVRGRYFTEQESARGSDKVIVGHKIAEELFLNGDAIGKFVKFYGRKFQVIGVLKEEGDNPFNLVNYDEVTWVPYQTARKFLNLNNTNRLEVGKLIYAKTKDGIDIEVLKDEINGKLRAIRKIEPREDDDFALNTMSMLNNLIAPVFSKIRLVGWIIGGFALLVGMISVANIMFVSVKERTKIIGIKKALGAKRYVILLEFMIEAVVLCIVGGAFGVLFVHLIMKLISSLLPLDFWLTQTNVIFGVVYSVIVGVVSGVIPAMQAANLDPVVAIRKG